MLASKLPNTNEKQIYCCQLFTGNRTCTRNRPTMPWWLSKRDADLKFFAKLCGLSSEMMEKPSLGNVHWKSEVGHGKSKYLRFTLYTVVLGNIAGFFGNTEIRCLSDEGMSFPWTTPSPRDDATYRKQRRARIILLQLILSAITWVVFFATGLCVAAP